jgi:hypothetical protein
MNTPKHTTCGDATKTKEYEAKLIDAEQKSGAWLAKGNEYAEKGQKARAEKCYAKSAFWLMRANKMRGW